MLACQPTDSDGGGAAGAAVASTVRTGTMSDATGVMLRWHVAQGAPASECARPCASVQPSAHHTGSIKTTRTAKSESRPPTRNIPSIIDQPARLWNACVVKK